MGIKKRGRAALSLGIVSLVALAFAAVALAATKTTTFGSKTAFSVGIPHNGVGVKTINIKKKGTIKDVNVRIAFGTNENDDYDFYLRNPGGRVIELSTGNGGSGSGYGDGSDPDCTNLDDLTTFDDEADTNIDDYQADTVFQGPYQPEQLDENTHSGGLGLFDGKNMKGKWQLIVGHSQEIGLGTLKCFRLQIKNSSK